MTDERIRHWRRRQGARHGRRPPIFRRQAVARLGWTLAGLCLAVTLTDPVAGVVAGAGDITAASSCPWLNQSLAIPTRVNMLLSRMSLTDKVAEMYINNATKTGPYAGYQGFAPSQRALCIPPLVEQDGPLGVAYRASDVTQLPAEVSLASAWDPRLAYQYGVVNGAEHRAKGIAMVLGPGVNIQRDPRWGRNFENFSEDPLLTSALGAADVEGLQSQSVMADVKHFVTYNQETNRGTLDDNTIVRARALNEIYLPPFLRAITQADAASVMCAYPLLNGAYSCENPNLITGLLKDRWGFQGFVRSDGGANASTVDSANAGLDQEKGSFFWDNGRLAAAVAYGQVRSSTITQAARRILRQMFRFDLFNDPPSGNLSSPAATPGHRTFALDAAERGTVLLQNKANLLPLSVQATKTIAVIGPDGTTDPQTAGTGSSYVKPSSLTTPLSGITARAGSTVTVSSYSGTDPIKAAAAARQAQVAIVFASYAEGEGKDLTNISLPNNQDAMIEAVAAANPNTIVVLNTGGPVVMPWLSSVSAVLEAWYPGETDGTAIASVLFGDIDPGGHLPETFPTSLSQISTASPTQFPGVNGRVAYSEGLEVGYRWYDVHHVKPLFPFGYGLSYTSFRFSHLTVTPASLVNRTSGPDAQVGQSARLARVSARITNTGDVRGSDVAQLYIGDPATAGEPPRQLAGFQRVTLMPHQTRSVSFAVTGHELSYFNPSADGWALPDGRFALYVGDSSALVSLPLRGRLEVTGTIGNRYARLTVPHAVDPGATFIAKARFVNNGDLPVTDGMVRFGFPSDWAVVRLARTRALSLAPGRSATRYFRVTVPERGEGEVKSLTARLSSPGISDAGELTSTVTLTVRGPITVSVDRPAIVAPSQSLPATIVVKSRMNRAVVVHLTPSLPPGVTITPAAPAVTVRPHGTANLKIRLTVAAGQPPATDRIPLAPSFTYRRKRYPLAAAALKLDIPYASLEAAFNSSAISDDSHVAAANFDGSGNSYSQQALTAAGLAPGANVMVNGATVQWPSAASGAPDNVLAAGQTISTPETPAASQLIVLGASSGAEESGTGLIVYSDGTTEPYRLTLDDWFDVGSPPDDTVVATVAYVNTSTGAGNNGKIGRRNRRARVFAETVPLEPGKSVTSVTLPTVATLPGVYPMHVFAMGLRLSGTPAYLTSGPTVPRPAAVR